VAKRRKDDMLLGEDKLCVPDDDFGVVVNCGITEECFPSLDKCCSKNNSISGTVYKKSCPYCAIWTSLPDFSSLEITYIIECSIYGYGERIKEQNSYKPKGGIKFMSEIIRKGKSKIQANKVQTNQKVEAEEKELDFDALDQVAGGISLSDVPKIETTDISEDTKSKA